MRPLVTTESTRSGLHTLQRPTFRNVAPLVRGAVVSAAFLLLAPAGDRITANRSGVQLELPALMLWAWDRNDDWRFIDPSDTGIAFLAATLKLRGDGIVLEARHNRLSLPEGTRRIAVAHVETERAEPPTLSSEQLHRFVEALAELNGAAPNHALQVDFEAVKS
jgi:hypothetical protein